MQKARAEGGPQYRALLKMISARSLHEKVRKRISLKVPVKNPANLRLRFYSPVPGSTPVVCSHVVANRGQ